MDNNTSSEKPTNKDENLNDIVDDKETKALSEKKAKKSFVRHFFNKKPKERKFDDKEKIDCISKVIGSYGPWQNKFVVFYMLIYLISPFQNYGIVFYAARADFWCNDIAQVSFKKKKNFFKVLVN